MRHPTHTLVVLIAASALFTSAVAAPRLAAQGTPIGFEEEFALSTERARALEQLIPGTEDHYYYRCLHLQHRGAYAEVEGLLRDWIKRHGRTGRVVEIENRQALLTYEQDPDATLAFLQRRLSLSFDHQRQVSGEKPDLPTALDPSLIAPATLTRRALRAHPRSVDGFRDSAFEFLVKSELGDDLLMSLMRRLVRPDLSNLSALVVQNLRHRESRGFGSLPIHQNLLLDQLEECVRLSPALIDETAFVETYLRRLAPSPDVQWRRDATARQDYLERLQAFADRLASAHNSLKAHVLHHRLAHDLALGAPDRDRFLAYLRLPRPAGYVNREHLRRSVRQAEMVDPGRSYPTGLTPVGDDEALVRAYLAHFFRTADSFGPYAELVQRDYLRRLFAETKILAGTGDMERWYSLLDDPAYYERLRQRVDIVFPPTQRTDYGADEPVSIEVDVKNVDNLLVKVFEINAFNFYRGEGREVDASIELDGLVANEETTHAYSESPLRRVRRRFDLPSLARPGVYVVELIGNGISSRAVIHKGRLQYTEHPGAAGQVFRVLDENGVHLRDASIWFGGREYGPDDAGELVIPYSTKPGRQSLILRHGELSTLERFDHRGEGYRLVAGIHLDRESLLARRSAKVLVRPSLLLNGRAVSLDVLEQPVLTVTARDQDGVASTLDVRNLALSSERELVHEIQVPDGLSVLQIALRGRVKSLSLGQTVEIACPAREFVVNAIDATAETGCPLLGRTAAGYVLDVLGKDGEPKPDRAVKLTLTHRDYTDSVEVTLKTDARGRIRLGPLDGITSVRASGFPEGVGAWRLRTAARTYPELLCCVSGETLRVPYQGAATVLERTAVSLLELRGGAFARDAFDRVALSGGYLELRDLAPGDYDLWLKEADRHIAVKVTDGERRDGWAVGRDRLLEVSARDPLHLTSLAAADDRVRIQLANATADTRVHVVATRYVVPFDPFDGLSGPAAPRPGVVRVTHPESSYHSGREIGDEYRYILARRFATKFPGNMLRRPGLLLNPWARDTTETAIGLGGGTGGRFRGRPGGRRSAAGPSSPGPSEVTGRSPGTFCNLEFLPEPAKVLANLRPDADGVVSVPVMDLGAGQLVHVLAADVESTVYASLAMPEQALAPKRRGLARSLDSAEHFAEQRRIEFVDRGAAAVLDDVTTSTAETYDSLAAVFQLFRTLSGEPALAEFAFVLRWPELTEEEKRELYSRHACHELHFFLHEKDPEFFERAVRPYLANKAHKTFLDRWLCGEDLAGYLDPWAFSRLNVVERILLARRIAGQAESVAGHVGELFDLVPPDLERSRRWFEGALKSGALDGQRDFGGKLDELREELRDERRRADKDRKPAPPSATRDRAPSAGAALERAEKALEAKDEAAGEEEQEPADDAPATGRAGRERLAQSDAQRGLAEDLARRKQVRRLYRAPEPTRQYVEHNYRHRPIHEQDADLIRVNAFWRDYAFARDGEPFFSTNLAEATSSFAEMMLALAVLDLPFQADEHATEVAGTRMTLRAASPLLLVRKEIKQAVRAADEAPILVSENFFRIDDRYRFDGNERRDVYVEGEFLVDVGYGCQVVVTNPTSSPRKLDLLLQIPQGAIPIQRGFYTRGHSVQLAAYGTSSLEYAFYFPRPGTVPHYPVQVSRNGQLVAAAQPATMRVVGELTSVDTTSWEHVSQNGTSEEVLRFLDGANLQRIELQKIAWRMRDRDFFAAVSGRLRARHAYDGVLWSYGIRHGDVPAIREYLRHADGFLASCGRYIASPLVTIDPVERRAYQHVEYEPLFNPRAHRFGERREILNQSLARQYLSLLGVLGYRPQLDGMDWMSVTYYMLLQDRVQEALASFARVDPAGLPVRLQYDYMRAYLDFFTDDHAVARSIAEQYRDYPVVRWRAKFEEVLAHLDQAVGEAVGVAVTDPESRTQQQGALAASDPALELEVESRRVLIRYRNLERCEVSYRDMDVEFLFSTHPFAKQGSGSLAYIRPNRAEIRALPASQTELAFDLPAEFHNSNVLVEVRGAGITARQAYYASSVAARVVETYGQLEVSHADTGRPLPKVYVKVFAQLADGKVRFHKDGYTDLRGRFDYASLSGEGAGSATRYAILVLSEDHGAVVREVAPPTE